MSSKVKELSIYLVIGLAGLGLGVSLAYLPRWLTPDYVEGNYTPYFPDAQTQVVLFSTETCPFCQKTRELLNEKKIKFVDNDVQKSPQAQGHFKSLNGDGVPLILIGNRQIRGYKPEVIEDAIKSLKK